MWDSSISIGDNLTHDQFECIKTWADESVVVSFSDTDLLVSMGYDYAILPLAITFDHRPSVRWRFRISYNDATHADNIFFNRSTILDSHWYKLVKPILTYVWYVESKNNAS